MINKLLYWFGIKDGDTMPIPTMRDLPKWMHYDRESMKPCPFCGSPVWGVFGLPEDIIVDCDGENCCQVHYGVETKAEAVALWNARATL